MSIFEFADYRVYLRQHFATFPHKGRGKFLELANRLNVHPTVVSQVFAGRREFTEEQAIEICEWLELSPIEAKYLRLLVRIKNAATEKLKKALRTESQEILRESKSLATRVRTAKELSDEERATFYSSWLYSACRLYCSTLASGRTIEDIAARFGISRLKAKAVMDFLTRANLAVASGDRYQMGSQSTFVDRHSPFLPKHLANWRIKAIQTIDSLGDDELMFSGPFSLSTDDLERLRERLAELIKDVAKVVKESPSEEVACLNIDLFRLR